MNEYIHTDIHTLTYIHTYTHTYIQDIHIHIGPTNTHTYIHACIHTYMNTFTHKNTHTDRQTNMNIHFSNLESNIALYKLKEQKSVAQCTTLVLQPLLCLRCTSSLERTPKRPPSVCTSS